MVDIGEMGSLGFRLIYRALARCDLRHRSWLVGGWLHVVMSGGHVVVNSGIGFVVVGELVERKVAAWSVVGVSCL